MWGSRSRGFTPRVAPRCERGLPSAPSMRRLVIVKGGTRNFQLMGCCDRASIRTRLTSLGTWCSMKFDLAALLSLSRPLWAGRGLAVAANAVCPFAVSIPDPSPDTTIPASPASPALLPLLPRAAFVLRAARGSFRLSPFPPTSAALQIGPQPSRARGARRSEPLTARTDLESWEQRERGFAAASSALGFSNPPPCFRSPRVLAPNFARAPGAAPGRISQRPPAAREFVS